MNKSSMTRFFSRNVRETGLIVSLVVIAILVQLRTGGVFLSSGNISDLFRETSILAMVSMGMMIVIISGHIDLSLGSIMGLSGMLGAIILRENNDIPLILLFLIAVGIGFVCGTINGFIIARFHIAPLIATLATQYIFRGVIYLFSHGYWVAQAEMTPAFIAVTTTNILGINSLIWFAIVLIVIISVLLRYTYTGRYFYAVGNSELSSEITGINVKRVKIIAFQIMGVICGLAGLLWVSKYGNAQSETAVGYEIDVIAATVLGGCAISGGMGKVLGVVFGALLIGTLNNVLPLIQVTTYWQSNIKGIVLLASIIINALVQKSSKRNAIRRRVI